jgi:hypothetical protein
VLLNQPENFKGEILVLQQDGFSEYSIGVTGLGFNVVCDIITYRILIDAVTGATRVIENGRVQAVN